MTTKEDRDEGAAEEPAMMTLDLCFSRSITALRVHSLICLRWAFFFTLSSVFGDFLDVEKSNRLPVPDLY